MNAHMYIKTVPSWTFDEEKINLNLSKDSNLNEAAFNLFDYLIKIKKLINIPVVAIGGINEKNYKNLLLNKADFLAISSYIWNNKKFKPHQAIKNLLWKLTQRK